MASAFEAALWVGFGVGFGYIGVRLYREHRVSHLRSRRPPQGAALLGGGDDRLRVGSALAHVAVGCGRARLVPAGRLRGVRAARGVPPLAQLLSRRAAAAAPARGGRLVSSNAMAATDRQTDSAQPQASLAEQRRALPDQPGVYLFRDGGGRVLYVGKAKSVRKRVASHFAKAQLPSSPGHAEMVGGRRAHRMRGRRLRGRGAAGGAELHQAVPPALQHPAARRQVLPVHRDLPRRELPAGLLHARAPPRGPRLLRPLLERQARAGDPGGAGEGLHVPLLHRPRAGQAQRQPLPGLLHQALRGALRGVCLQGGVPGEHRRRDGLPLGALLGDRDRPRRAHARGRRGGGVRAGDARAQPPASGSLAAGAQAGDQRVGGHVRRGRRRDRRPRGQRPGLPGARRRALRPPVVLPLQRDRARHRRGGRGVHAPVLRRAHVDPGAAGRAARARRAPRSRRRALAPPRGPGRAARGRARREAADPRAGRAQRAPRARPGASARGAAAPEPRGGAGGPAAGARPRRAADPDRVLRHLQPRRHPHGGLDGRLRGRRAEEGRLPALHDPHGRGVAGRLRLDGRGALAALRASGSARPTSRRTTRPTTRASPRSPTWW